MKHHIATGRTGESIAASYLVKNGISVLERNWRFKRLEVDIIAVEKKVLIFCEVKTRSNSIYGDPASFVDIKKQKLLIDIAVMYMQKHNFTGEFRFDIIAILMKNPEEYALKHFRDAFFPGLDGF